MDLIDSLIQRGWLKTPRIIKAFRQIRRVDFLPASLADTPAELQDLAELDEALAIGRGQTISQPLVVAFMLELLQPKTGEKILDIGSGSGWTAALLAEIAGSMGKVVAVEIIPELKKFGQSNATKYKPGIEFVCADGNLGYAKEAPFDKILVSASLSDEIPFAWKEQLKTGGHLVTPMVNSIWLLTKKNKAEFEKREYPGFVFVPLVKS